MGQWKTIKFWRRSGFRSVSRHC